MNLLVNIIAKQIIKGLDEEMLNRSPLMQEAFLNDIRDLLDILSDYTDKKQKYLIETINNI